MKKTLLGKELKETDKKLSLLCLDPLYSTQVVCVGKVISTELRFYLNKETDFSDFLHRKKSLYVDDSEIYCGLFFFVQDFSKTAPASKFKRLNPTLRVFKLFNSSLMAS